MCTNPVLYIFVGGAVEGNGLWSNCHHSLFWKEICMWIQWRPDFESRLKIGRYSKDPSIGSYMFHFTQEETFVVGDPQNTLQPLFSFLILPTAVLMPQRMTGERDDYYK